MKSYMYETVYVSFQERDCYEGNCVGVAGNIEVLSYNWKNIMNPLWK